MAMSTIFALLLCSYGVLAGKQTYPVSGSWFHDRVNVTDLNHTLSAFKLIGGDTILLQGAELRIRQPDDIRSDPEFADCMIDDTDCVSAANKLLNQKGLYISQWLTYSHSENFTEKFAVCNGVDKRIQIGKKVYYILILWANDEDPADCMFQSEDKVSVLFTYYNGEGDANDLILQQARLKNMSVYLGLPQVKNFIGTLQLPISQPLYLLNDRIMADHDRRYRNTSAMKGYYSDAEVIADRVVDIQQNSEPESTQAKDVLFLWRHISKEALTYNMSVIGAPSLDLTHASNTTIQRHIDGMTELAIWTWMNDFIIRDSTGSGKAAYFWPMDSDQPISYRDKNLVEMLKQRNSSVDDRTTYNDIYYASISQFFRQYKGRNIPTWLMIEAFEEIEGGEPCQNTQVSTSRMGNVHRVDKSHLDKALTHVGSMVQKVTAYAWDPLFTCKTSGDKKSLAQQITANSNQSVAGECSFVDPPSNLTIAMTGFNIDSPGKFRVEYQFFTGKEGVNYIKSNFADPDYGKKHGLVDSLTYVEIPFGDGWTDLAKKGYIRIMKMDNYNSWCQFNYNFLPVTTTRAPVVLG